LGAAAEDANPKRVTLDKPVQISTVRADHKLLDGKLVAYDEEGFDLVRGKDKAVRVKWSELAAPGVYNVTSSIIGPKAGGEDWMWVGRTMQKVEGGAPFADKAFARAVKLDPKLQEAVDALKRPAADKTEKSEPSESSTTQEDSAAPSTAAGPQMIGKVRSGAWPPQTDEQRAKRVAELKTFAEDAAKKLNRPLQLNETKYFLFFSDLPPHDARNWAGLLDRMYARLAELFAVQRETATTTGSRPVRGGSGDYVNVWDGKALVFVFQGADDYRRFQRVVHDTDAGSSAGMCHCFGDGRVHIAFYRQADPLTFAHVLVHESVHGFVHRFRTPAVVPSWANEGLAEVIASELVPRPGRAREREMTAKAGLQGRAELGGMFEAKHIEPWQYPVAETLCAYMIRQSRANYVEFIAGIKDGLTWQQSLEQRYRAPRERLAGAYRQSLGLKQ
jgi:hypothetical protein